MSSHRTRQDDYGSVSSNVMTPAERLPRSSDDAVTAENAVAM